MKKITSLSTKALLSAFFILTACTPCSNWQYESIYSHDPCFHSAKISSCVNNFFVEPEVEINYNSQIGLRLYLNLYGCPIPSSLVNEGNVAVTILFPDRKEVIQANILFGNQKILLPESCSQSLINCLLNEKAVAIHVGNYYTNIPTEGFCKKYYKLMKSI
ncbi:MAG: hypothetical protein ACSNEK_05890 [Parachlamydiaceae bacterium]